MLFKALRIVPFRAVTLTMTQVMINGFNHDDLLSQDASILAASPT